MRTENVHSEGNSENVPALEVGQKVKPFEAMGKLPGIKNPEEVEVLCNFPFRFKDTSGQISLCTFPPSEQTHINPITPLGPATFVRIFESGRMVVTSTPIFLELSFRITSIAQFDTLDTFKAVFILGGKEYSLLCGGRDEREIIEKTLQDDGEANPFDVILQGDNDGNETVMLPYDLQTISGIEFSIENR